MLASFLDISKLTLDLGCGTAPILDYFKHAVQYIRYWGVDISPEMIKIARKKHSRAHFIPMDMSDLRRFGSGTFDNVISLFGSFCYARNPIQVSKQIEWVLKPGGKFFIIAYGKRYKNRKSYILNQYKEQSPALCFNKQNLLDIFSWAENIETHHITCLSESLVNILSPKLLNQYFKWEAKYLSKIVPNQFYFHIITGNKHA
jgi:ubiquinone/menaquinone biosynthesis C-methylase UbiE